MTPARAGAPGTSQKTATPGVTGTLPNGQTVHVAATKYEDVFAKVWGGSGDEEYVGQEWQCGANTCFSDFESGEVYTFDAQGNLK
jgi:hypothetical protein